MRSLPLFGAAMLMMAGAALSAADPLSGLRFTDGKTHSFGDYSKQTLIVVHFCSE